MSLLATLRIDGEISNFKVLNKLLKCDRWIESLLTGFFIAALAW